MVCFFAVRFGFYSDVSCVCLSLEKAAVYILKQSERPIVARRPRTIV